MKKLIIIGLMLTLGLFANAQFKGTALETSQSLTYTADSGYVYISVGLGTADSCLIQLDYGTGFKLRTNQMESWSWPPAVSRVIYVKMTPYGGYILVNARKR